MTSLEVLEAEMALSGNLRAAARLLHEAREAHALRETPMTARIVRDYEDALSREAATYGRAALAPRIGGAL